MSGKAIHKAVSLSSLQHDEVLDKGSLYLFLQKRGEWFSWYEVSNNDPNSIHMQIISMIVSEMSYRVLLEERKHQPAGQGCTIPILMDLLDRGYLATQVLATRKLLDKGDDVLSLRRILDDIEQNQHFLTREAYVSFDGTPYEMPEWPSSVVPNAANQLTSLGLEPPGFAMYVRSRERHNRFDRLAKVTSEKRSRFDRISPEVFLTLERWIQDSGAHRLITLGNKYIAHAADPHSIGKLKAAGLKFTDVEKVQKKCS